MVEDELLFQGAEAKIIASTYFRIPVVKKIRMRKRYRIKEIDNRLISTRTRDEAKLMILARQQGVSVPIIFDIDLAGGVLTMQYLMGKRVKDIYNDLSLSQRKKICNQIGNTIAILHNNDIIHGDITTSNLMLLDDRIYFFDFGLGEINPDIEAKGVDLHVLMEAMESTHSVYSSDFSFVFDGYAKCYDQDATEVKTKIEDIVRRGRYR